MSDYPCRSCGESRLVEVAYGVKVVMVFCGVCCKHSRYKRIDEPESSTETLTRDGQIEVKGYGWGV